MFDHNQFCTLVEFGASRSVMNRYFWEDFAKRSSQLSAVLVLGKNTIFLTFFQAKAAIVDKISNIMIDKTGQKNRTDRINTTGRRDMGDSMTGLTNRDRHNHLTDLGTVQHALLTNNIVLSVIQIKMLFL